MIPLFFELGVEEVPARLQARAERELADRLAKGLDGLGLAHGAFRTFSTPRRLALAVDVQAGQPDVTQDVTGPPAKVAFDAQGNPTRAAEAFAKRWGLDVRALKTVETDKGAKLGATVHTKGKAAAELLPALLEEAIAKLHWPKAMRWGSGRTAFIRPVHWMVCLLDGEVLPVRFAGLASGRTTRGHRFHAPGTFEVTDVEQWLSELRSRHVEPDRAVRREVIVSGAKACADEVDGVIPFDEELVEEVVGLVEHAVPLRGTFEQRYLDVPAQVLVMAMKVHQRYFPIRTPDGALTPHFVLVAGTVPNDPKVVVAGNEKVIRARLADAEFFFQQDKAIVEKDGLEHFVEYLQERTFLKGLGTMRQKALRLSSLAGRLARQLKPGDPDATSRANRAGLLAKADLSTAMVGEFAKLQGEMGRDYARIAGESEAIASAIEEHYRPRFADDAVPSSKLGTAVALADKLDSIVGCFALGLEPTGSADPYALRRQALGVLRMLMDDQQADHAPTLSNAVETACHIYDDDVSDDWAKVRGRVLTFFRGRLKNLLADSYATDLVEAVLSAGFDVPRDVVGRLDALSTLKRTDEWDALAEVVKRTVNIVASAADKGIETVAPTDADAFDAGAERGLYEAFAAVEAQATAAADAGDWHGALGHVATLKPAIDRFFDDVLAMSDDPAERARRIGLLAEIADRFHRLADFSKVST